MTTCLSIIKDDNRSAVGLARPFPAMAKMVSQKKNSIGSTTDLLYQERNHGRLQRLKHPDPIRKYEKR